MLAQWITTRITMPIVGGAIGVALILAGWQAVEANVAKGRLARAEAQLATERASLATATTTIAQLRTTLQSEREAAGADLARCLADAQAEADRQYRAGEAAARLSRNCVHDQGRGAVTRSLRDVLGEPK